MPRLCSHSSRSYPGRSARHGCVGHGEVSDQSGHWWNKPGRMGDAATPVRANKAASSQAHTARHGAIPGVIGQKSAEAILAKRLL
jgi:hypothetical protein